MCLRSPCLALCAAKLSRKSAHKSFILGMLPRGWGRLRALSRRNGLAVSVLTTRSFLGLAGNIRRAVELLISKSG